MASEAEWDELLEWICNTTGQLARGMLHVITTPHLVKITSQKLLRTLKTKLSKGRCHQMDHPLPLPFSTSQQKMHLGENVLYETNHHYGQNWGTVPCGHIVFVGFLTATVSIHSTTATNGRTKHKYIA